MAELDSLLFQVFERLRRQGVPLGVSDYLEAIETIQAGIGLEDAASFKGLCRLLWAKSREDQELFDTAFAELVEPQIAAPTLPKTFSSTSDTQPQRESAQELNLQQERMVLRSGSVSQSLFFKTDLTEEPRHYQLIPRLPMSRRDMAGIWRQLRRPQRTGIPEELDVEGTINDICRTGFLLCPVLQPRRRNQARLVVLVDQQGSMAPFAPLIEAAIESILRGGLLGKTSLYYFHDCPEEYLYQRPSLTNALPLEAVLDEQAKGNWVLIISDAGAARGYYDRRRVADTKSFLQTLSTYTYLYTWLNPMPQNRWVATTAEDIADMIPMFPLDQEGLNDAVNILRGHPFPGGVDIDE
ncbi:MAG: VWA domain-containing protein [Xenococcaceae cyanobacterium]